MWLFIAICAEPGARPYWVRLPGRALGQLHPGLVEGVVALDHVLDLDPLRGQQVGVVQQGRVAGVGPPGHAEQLALPAHRLQGDRGVVLEVVLVPGDDRVEVPQQPLVGEVLVVAQAGPDHVPHLPGGVQGLHLGPVLRLGREHVQDHLDVGVLLLELRDQALLPLGVRPLAEVDVDLRRFARSRCPLRPAGGGCPRLPAGRQDGPRRPRRGSARSNASTTLA